MPYNCPECHKSLKNKHSLAEHMKRVHGGKPPEPKSKPKAEPKTKAKAQKFQVAKPPPAAKDTYKCGVCSSPLDGEASPCPKCGADLNWS